MQYHKGDIVKATVRRMTNGFNMSQKLGTFEAKVVSAAQGSDSGETYEVNLVPTDHEEWDHACDLIGHEGSMDWSDIRDMRQSGVIENFAVEDVELFERAVQEVTHSHVESIVKDGIDQMYQAVVGIHETLNEGDTICGDEFPHALLLRESATEGLTDIIWTWYRSNLVNG